MIPGAGSGGAGPLAPGSAHVWLAFPEQIRREDLLRAYRDLLNPEESERHDRFRFPEHRHEYLVAHVLLRVSLSRYAPVDPREWAFSRNQHGRPEIRLPAGLPPLRFNLSHTTGLVACAVTLRDDIGVDVENTRRESRTVEIADRFFSPEEVRELRTLPAEAQDDRFFDYWTLKEAYIKARGMGLVLPLDGFACRIGTGDSIGISFAPSVVDRPAEWRFALFSPSERHRAALAVRTGGAELRLRVWRCVPLVGEEEMNFPEAAARR